MRTLNLTTREQVIAAYDDGTLVRAGLGVKSLAELRRALGCDPPLTTASLPSRCPKCGGESGFRAKVVRTEVRLYTWADVLESTPEVRHQSNTRIECR
ncbi:MAG: hypothetical protein JNN30_07750, partial [Rhodanobacteraceae bacterium]|nr:hypothetical protein [Rhodanobacteraceae bacterium]